MKLISLIAIALFLGSEIWSHAGDIIAKTATGETTILLGKPSDLKPPCRAEITTHANGGPNDFYITLTDSSKQEFAFQLVDKDIHFMFADQKQSKPGSTEEQALLAILKDIDARTYNPSLEKNFDFPYPYGKSGTCFNQLALQFAIRILELRSQTKSKVNPDGIEFYPQTARRMNIAGLSLLGQGWKEVANPSDLKPPCTACSIESAMSDDANFQFILIDTDKQLLAVSYGGQKLYVGKIR